MLRKIINNSVNGTRSVEALYLYDASGNRLKKLVRNQQRSYDVKTYYNVFERRSKYSSNDSLLNESIAVKLDTVSYQSGNHPDEWNDEVWSLCDHLGSPNSLVSGTGAGLMTIYNNPFGEETYSYYHNQRYRYCGKELDSESGLYYYGARYYAAVLGRFVSVDPLAGKYAQLSPYNYAGNDPVGDLDIDGMQSTSTDTSETGANTSSTSPNTGTTNPDTNCIVKPQPDSLDNSKPAWTYETPDLIVTAPRLIEPKVSGIQEDNTRTQLPITVSNRNSYFTVITNNILGITPGAIKDTTANSGPKAWISPIKNPRVSSGPGMRTVKGKPDNHPGYDIVPSKGTYKPGEAVPILAPTTGKISTFRNKMGNGKTSDPGNIVILEVSPELFLYFYHMDDNKFPFVSRNDNIEQGDTLGFMGDTGYSFGKHLHFEARTGKSFTGKNITSIVIKNIPSISKQIH